MLVMHHRRSVAALESTRCVSRDGGTRRASPLMFMWSHHRARWRFVCIAASPTGGCKRAPEGGRSRAWSSCGGCRCGTMEKERIELSWLGLLLQYILCSLIGLLACISHVFGGRHQYVTNQSGEQDGGNTTIPVPARPDGDAFSFV
jgi:hypothetical protein